jgi:hypothetical protein
MLLLTIILGLNLPSLRATIHTAFSTNQIPVATATFGQRVWSKVPTSVKNTIDSSVSQLERSNEDETWSSFWSAVNEITLWYKLLFFAPLFIIFFLHVLPKSVLCNCLIPEILYPKYQWHLFQYRHNHYVNIRWNPILLFVDVFRFLLLPVWIVLALALSIYFAIPATIFLALLWIGKSLWYIVKCGR